MSSSVIKASAGGGGEAPGPGREPWALRDARDFARWAKHVSPPPDAAGRERRARARDACVWLPMLGGHAGCGPPTGDEVVQPVLRPAAGTECVPSLILSLGLAAWPSGTSFQLPADAKLCGPRPRLSRSPESALGMGPGTSWPSIERGNARPRPRGAVQLLGDTHRKTGAESGSRPRPCPQSRVLPSGSPPLAPSLSVTGGVDLRPGGRKLPLPAFLCRL